VWRFGPRRLTPGYRYCPGRDRVIGWFSAAGLQIIDEGFSQEDGRGYRHFLLQKTGP
jgi:hypothetical protein